MSKTPRKLTNVEKKAIRDLKKALRNLPKSLSLLFTNGLLCVYDSSNCQLMDYSDVLIDEYGKGREFCIDLDRYGNRFVLDKYIRKNRV